MINVNSAITNSKVEPQIDGVTAMQAATGKKVQSALGQLLPNRLSDNQAPSSFKELMERSASGESGAQFTVATLMASPKAKAAMPELAMTHLDQQLAQSAEVAEMGAESKQKILDFVQSSFAKLSPEMDASKVTLDVAENSLFTSVASKDFIEKFNDLVSQYFTSKGVTDSDASMDLSNPNVASGEEALSEFWGQIAQLAESEFGSVPQTPKQWKDLVDSNLSADTLHSVKAKFDFSIESLKESLPKSLPISDMSSEKVVNSGHLLNEQVTNKAKNPSQSDQLGQEGKEHQAINKSLSGLAAENPVSARSNTAEDVTPKAASQTVSNANNDFTSKESKELELTTKSHQAENFSAGPSAEKVENNGQALNEQETQQATNKSLSGLAVESSGSARANTEDDMPFKTASQAVRNVNDELTSKTVKDIAKDTAKDLELTTKSHQPENLAAGPSVEKVVNDTESTALENSTNNAESSKKDVSEDLETFSEKYEGSELLQPENQEQERMPLAAASEVGVERSSASEQSSTKPQQDDSATEKNQQMMQNLASQEGSTEEVAAMQGQTAASGQANVTSQTQSPNLANGSQSESGRSAGQTQQVGQSLSQQGQTMSGDSRQGDGQSGSRQEARQEPRQDGMMSAAKQADNANGDTATNKTASNTQQLSQTLSNLMAQGKAADSAPVSQMMQAQQKGLEQQANMRSIEASAQQSSLLLDADGVPLTDSASGERRASLPPGLQSIPLPVKHPQWGQALGQRVAFMANSQLQQAQITLNPEKLGPIQIKLHMDRDQQMQVSLNAQQGTTREAIEAALPRLREMLEQNGVQLGSVDVGDFSQFAEQQMQDESNQSASSTGTMSEGSEDESTLVKEQVVNLESDKLVDYYA